MSDPFLKTLSVSDNKGFTLIEVFALLVVVTFGLLALISMKVSSLRKTNTPEHTVLAHRIVQKVSERIQENGAQVQAYVGMRTATNEKMNCHEKSPRPDCLRDFMEWQNAVSALPKGDLTIALDADKSPKKVDVNLSWQDQVGNHRVKVPIHLE